MMHRVRMLITEKGVPDGKIYPSAFFEGEEYEVGDELLQSFIQIGAVELVEGAKSPGGAPANKLKKPESR